MKKLIPIFSIAIASVLLQNCTDRDEDVSADHSRSNDTQPEFMMRGDSTRSSGEIVDPDPPVRDGDNWRSVPKK
ncbi:Uncharacterised protein [Chryseobacterium nakagawai]|uniref:Lipoprotein n=1 Tax=Chryseobacterium nakagawai TaxID=1241982 RepID=A0AAD0YI84_CHRNA|nr:hypothetical protein EG343_03935 [Chryseobacterium nakagawai]VEH21240.1 Uncharacterised protein [Chryseobacterium nakagawai]VFA41309.1 Uncharacterised protein [Chryseobacterium indologenes]